MNKKLLVFLIPLFYMGLVFSSLALAANEVEFKNRPVYRFYNVRTQEHMYTQNEDERAVLRGAVGTWNEEGIGWYAPDQGQPVYRLNNVKSGTHLFTTSRNEVNELQKNPDWVIDFNGEAAFYSGGTIPIYRLYNRDLFGVHHLTTDGAEYASLAQAGWTQEGVQFYGSNESEKIIYPDGDATLENTPCEYGIEADVSLKGSGTGIHSKIVICSPTSAVSYGIQHDEYAVAPYRDRTGFIIENVHSNNTGGQDYSWTGYAELSHSFHLMLTVQKDGTIATYINGELTNKTINKELAGEQLYLRVEGSGRKNGDYLDSNFTGIKLVTGGKYDPDKEWGTYFFQENPGLKAIDNFQKDRRIRIVGTISNLLTNDDWDSKYESCSGIIQFVE